jgi:hypothetical protein
VIGNSEAAYENIWPVTPDITDVVCGELLRTRPDIHPFYIPLMLKENMLGSVIYVCHLAGICPSLCLLLTSRISPEPYLWYAFYCRRTVRLFFLLMVGGLTYSCRRALTKDGMTPKPTTLHAYILIPRLT